MMQEYPIQRAKQYMQRKHYFIGAGVFFILIISYFSRSVSNIGETKSTEPPPPPPFSPYDPNSTAPRDLAANATLGFQKILAISRHPSWRTRGLLKAAEYTGLQIEIPAQPQNSKELIEAYMNIGKGVAQNVPPLGSATAWLAHLDMLKYIISANIESAFVIEDDVDWDVSLKDQIRLVSDNVRKFTDTPDSDPNPYGSSWDVLWLGHCGERANDANVKHVAYDDPSVQDPKNYSGWSKKWFMNQIPKATRWVQTPLQPVCTFGYALTKQSAQKILSVTSKGQDEAFDISLMHNCVSKRLNCITLNPELMHHYEPPRASGYVSPVHESDGKGHAADETKFEHEKGQTANILHSARCRVLFSSDCLAPPSNPDMYG